MKPGETVTIKPREIKQVPLSVENARRGMSLIPFPKTPENLSGRCGVGGIYLYPSFARLRQVAGLE